jgi:sugar lactone lactonase YvrE
MSLRLSLLASFAVLLALVPAGTAAAHRDKSPEVVASGLDNPRDLDVTPWGTVYVTEAGRGGSGPCLTSEETGTNCAGATGAVTQIRHGEQRRVLEGLPSLAPPGGDGALGPSDISLRRWGGAYLTVGLGADPAVRSQLGDLGPDFGQLYKISSSGRLSAVADISAYEAAANPDGGAIDSNPNSVTEAWGKLFVVDAGGNSLLRVHRSGEISTVAVFPDRLVTPPPGMGLPDPFPLQAVPTNVVAGPDGALYVSQLTGFPFIPGAANIYRVEKGSAPEVYAAGLTNVTDLAFDRHGNLYVVEIAANGLASGDPTGALIKIRPDGSRETVLTEGLVNPYGVAIGDRGDIYVSNHGSSAGIGEVLRLRSDHHHQHH